MKVFSCPHDGHIFHWTQEALNAEAKGECDLIGFYFDGQGQARPVYGYSVYGTQIKIWMSEDK